MTFDAEEFGREWIASRLPALLAETQTEATPPALGHAPLGKTLLARAQNDTPQRTIVACDQCGAHLQASLKALAVAIFDEPSPAVCSECMAHLDLIFVDEKLVSFSS